MTSKRNNRWIWGLLAIMLALLVYLDLSSGTQWICLWCDAISPVEQQILWQIRLPKMLTAILAGAALAVSGLMMQTLFRNPLAGPYILGVSSGASLGVALVTIGGLSSFLGVHWAGNLLISLAAIIGSSLVMLLVMSVAQRLRSNVSLLIVGMMIGAIAGAVVNVLQNFANPDALKLFITWTLGSFGSVGWTELNWLAGLVITGLLGAVLLIKQMDGLRLGENYAQGLGIRVERTRIWLVLLTGVLAGTVTAFCGPIAFVGVAVPHIARGLWKTSSHRVTMPGAILLGANLMVLCDWLSSLTAYPLPISTLSALFGAPVIIYIIVKG